MPDKFSPAHTMCTTKKFDDTSDISTVAANKQELSREKEASSASRTRPHEEKGLTLPVPPEVYSTILATRGVCAEHKETVNLAVIARNALLANS